MALPNAEVRIVDDEILVKGPCVMKGYFRNESATQEALSDGWLRTGDLGHFDRDGFLFISGRRKSVIVTPNGKNVYPEEVEGVLNQSEFVLESLVWGGPEEDPSLTEVQAIVVPDPEAFDRAFQSEGWDDDRIQVVIAEAV
ncbi:MAG: AMP-binding protein, partial [Acidobacteriota bacterium]